MMDIRFSLQNTFQLVLSLILTRIDRIDCRNVVSNPSFEFLLDWQVRERLSAWEVLPAKAESLNLEAGPARSGTMSLRLGPNKPANSQAVFVTQVIPNVNLPKVDHRSLLKLVYWIRGKDASLVSVHVDVSYVDSSHLMVTLPVNEISEAESQKDFENDEDSGFFRRCSFIPAYGDIRTIAVHIVLEGQASEPVYVDDVTLDFVDTYDDRSCPLNTDSFPKKRQVIPHILSPTIPYSNRTITLCTQMTYDRFPTLLSTVKSWNGPVSVALLLFKEDKRKIKEIISDLTEKYYKSQHLSYNVAFHVVIEDLLNEQDSSMFPVNFLRNVALKFATTSHVFFVDADIIPGFSERQAWGWMGKAQFLFRNAQNHFCQQCAFIAPVFNVKKNNATLPVSKAKLLKGLKEQTDTFEIFLGVSHSMIQYGKWKEADKPYEVSYRNNQEPYFIVQREAPLMNDLFAGYGRDKCVYSKELDRLGYNFIVLNEAFLLNKLDPIGAKTILSRSRGLSLRVFLSIEYHWRDLLDSKFSTTRENFLPEKQQFITVTNRTKCLRSADHEFKETVTKVRETDKDDGGIGCHVLWMDDLLIKTQLPVQMFVRTREQLRKDVLIEKMMHEFRIGLFIEYPQTMTGTIRLMFPLMHPDAAVTVIPNSNEEKYIIDGPFEVFKSKRNISSMLTELRTFHKGPAIFSINLAEIKDIKDVTTERILEYLFAALSIASDRDIVVFQGNHPSLELLHHDMCNMHPNWKIYHHPGSNVIIMKSASLINNQPLKAIRPPRFVYATVKPECEPNQIKVDVILMTRNRPLQTYAFLDSLRQYLSNVNKIWILYRADDKVFEEGYDLAFSCAERSLTLEGIPDNKGEFGKKLLDILKQSEAQYIVLGVDEMIWLRYVDLQYAACMLKKGDGKFFSMQLRLGEKIGSFPKDKDTKEKRFFKMAHNSSVYAYYPLRLAYDVGYVLNVDGMMVSRLDFLKDLGDTLPKHRHPGDLENGWVYKKIHIRSKQWHLMFDKSVVVNNGNLDDGRQANHAANISQKAYNNAQRFVKDRQKIDIVRFSYKHRDPPNTHINQLLNYMDLDC